MGELIDKTTSVLAKALDGTSARHRVLADNIANIDTPGYTRKDLTFEAQLRDVISRQDAHPDAAIARIKDVALSVETDTTSPARADGNNVDVEREMALLAKNALQYESSAQLLSMKLRGIKSAIYEGRK